MCAHDHVCLSTSFTRENPFRILLRRNISALSASFTSPEKYDACVLQQDFTDVLMSREIAARSDLAEESEKEEEESESGGSEEERSICLSPSKSPRKLSRVLKRKRTPSDDLDEESDVENSEESVEEANTVAVTEKEPTGEDFQFKEPKFRKKKFIFHPFSRNGEGSLVPDPSSSAVEVCPSVSSLMLWQGSCTGCDS